jgi:hypothetical protein
VSSGPLGHAGSQNVFTAKLDREDEKKMLARYKSDAVEYILKEAAKAGGKAGAQVLKAEAPIGTSKRLSQYYRRNGLKHGTFKRSIRAALIRGRGSAIKGLQGKTVGYVIGPIGKNAFTRAWIELGTKHQPAHHWMEDVASAALGASYAASDAVLTLYAER